jgi:DNA sulfur modification protein DndC
MKQEFDTKTIEMFGLDIVMPSIEERVAEATEAIAALFRAGHPVVCAFSGGKDSTVVASITLNAAAAFTKAGGKPLVIFTTGDTLVENPEISEHYQSELAKAREFGKKHGFRVITKVVSPTYASSFQLSILSGRALPSWAGTRGDCSVDFKIQPQRAFRRKLFRQLKEKHWLEPVTLLGTRMEESTRRALHMKARGDRADVPVRNKDNELVLCPLALWATEDIWEFAGMVTSGLWSAFTDFQETMRIYSHSAGTSCAVVADAIHEGASAKKGGCGARHGCWSCLQAEDKSLEAMIEFDERYAYARGLNRLNKFLRNIRYDWNSRHWVGRTVRAGYIAVQPDTLHPRVLRQLGQFMIQLDWDEEQRAGLAREKPKFRILPEDMMLAIDAMQSLNGVAKPYQIWADYRDIRSGRVRYDIPDIEPVKPTELPAARFLYVGDDWDETADYMGLNGLRDPYYEGLTEGSPCAPELTVLKSGETAWDLQTGQSLDVDQESLFMLLDFEMENMLAKHDNGFFPGGITEAYKWYLQYGVLTISHSQQSEHDEVCRRTAYKDRLGLTLDYDINDLLTKSVSFADLPDAARKAWSHKGSTETSQTSFLDVLDHAAEELLQLA